MKKNNTGKGNHNLPNEVNEPKQNKKTGRRENDPSAQNKEHNDTEHPHQEKTPNANAGK